MAKPSQTGGEMRVVYPVFQVAELAAGYRYMTVSITSYRPHPPPAQPALRHGPPCTSPLRHRAVRATVKWEFLLCCRRCQGPFPIFFLLSLLALRTIFYSTN